LQRPHGVADERLRQQQPRVRPHGRQRRRATRREERHGPNAELIEQPNELVLDDIGDRPDDQHPGGLGARHLRDQRLETVVLALRERRLDPAATEVQDAHPPRVAHRQPLGSRGEIELDHLGRT
jgi:hypothetical protein